jgi:hypothetical protein
VTHLNHVQNHLIAHMVKFVLFAVMAKFAINGFLLSNCILNTIC